MSAVTYPVHHVAASDLVVPSHRPRETVQRSEGLAARARLEQESERSRQEGEKQEVGDEYPNKPEHAQLSYSRHGVGTEQQDQEEECGLDGGTWPHCCEALAYTSTRFFPSRAV